MEIKNFNLPTIKEIQNHSIFSLSKYWKNKNHLIKELPVRRIIANIVPGTQLKLESILLPDWAKNMGLMNVYWFQLNVSLKII